MRGLFIAVVTLFPNGLAEGSMATVQADLRAIEVYLGH